MGRRARHGACFLTTFARCAPSTTGGAGRCLLCNTLDVLTHGPKLRAHRQENQPVPRNHYPGSRAICATSETAVTLRHDTYQRAWVIASAKSRRLRDRGRTPARVLFLPPRRDCRPPQAAYNFADSLEKGLRRGRAQIVGFKCVVKRCRMGSPLRPRTVRVAFCRKASGRAT